MGLAGNDCRVFCRHFPFRVFWVVADWRAVRPLCSDGYDPVKVCSSQLDCRHLLLTITWPETRVLIPWKFRSLRLDRGHLLLTNVPRNYSLKRLCAVRHSCSDPVKVSFVTAWLRASQFYWLTRPGPVEVSLSLTWPERNLETLLDFPFLAFTMHLGLSASCRCIILLLFSLARTTFSQSEPRCCQELCLLPPPTSASDPPGSLV